MTLPNTCFVAKQQCLSTGDCFASGVKRFLTRPTSGDVRAAEGQYLAAAAAAQSSFVACTTKVFTTQCAAPFDQLLVALQYPLIAFARYFVCAGKVVCLCDLISYLCSSQQL